MRTASREEPAVPQPDAYVQAMSGAGQRAQQIGSVQSVPRLTAENLVARRRTIIDGARRCFARDGYEGATVRRLEAEIGLSRGAIFHHFRDKESLFFAVAEDDAAEMAAVVAEHGLVQLMRDLRYRDAGWLGVQLELSADCVPTPISATAGPRGRSP